MTDHSQEDPIVKLWDEKRYENSYIIPYEIDFQNQKYASEVKNALHMLEQETCLIFKLGLIFQCLNFFNF